jgi:tetraacyldisaccharide 4'-kinase
VTTPVARRIEGIWAADGFGARALAPLSWVFGGIAALRNAAYDHGLFRSHDLGSPTVSVGNLSVGGTGKTPISAWVAQRLLALGARPGIVLRGYGDDETLVHQRLTPGAVVVADADRVRGAGTARAGGAQVIVLDDAFQHRRARRDADLVLVAAEQAGAHRLLPAGPLREGAGALRRASALVITRKSASLEAAQGAAERWGRVSGTLPTVIASLRPASLARMTGAGEESRPLGALAGQEVLAISAIGSPGAFAAQLQGLGARVTAAAYPDHHPFTDEEVEALAQRAGASGMVVCTLKDAVKLEGRWPRQAPPLWYLSQAVVIEQGGAALDAVLQRLVTARPS